MSKVLNFRGFIKGVSYKAHLTKPLQQYALDEFNINDARSYGLIRSDGSEVAYSKWVSPKRTRSYPFERIYHTYNSAKLLTVIPVLKDEGKDGDLDKIQYSTISWMNLSNVYIVLAFYETAEKNNSKTQKNRHKLTKQRFNNEFVKAQITEILSYKQSALHWNKNLFEVRFVEIFRRALMAYQTISQKTSVAIHDQKYMQIYLEQILADFNHFKTISLKGSLGASRRETLTQHKMEYLRDGAKAQFFIENYLGGIYYLTADEVIFENDKCIIQESKNSTKGFLPSLGDILDGLFKLILYANLDSLQLEKKKIAFRTRLHLTGNKVVGSIKFPCSENEFEHFLKINQQNLNATRKEILKRLQAEAFANKNLEIQVSRNY
jgi:hypothetical protein